MLQAMALLRRRLLFVPTPQPCCRLFLVPTRINSVSPREIYYENQILFSFLFFFLSFLLTLEHR
jgi:hypothetical protein